MTTGNSDTKRPTIYIVDDDANLREALTDLLANAGYNPAAFANPAEFLEKFDPNQHGCLVLDVRMPEISGLEIQQRLNRMGSLLPVILMTGHGEVPMAVQAFRDGALDFLQKPFRFQALLERIKTALQLDLEKRASMAQRAEFRRREQSLTELERKVMTLVIEGHPDQVIAVDLGLSEQTAAALRIHAMEKMAADSVAHLIKMQLLLSDDPSQTWANPRK